jgi:hypothetical protein
VGVTPERNGVTSDARLHVARKTKHCDDWDPKLPVGTSDEFIDD